MKNSWHESTLTSNVTLNVFQAVVVIFVNLTAVRICASANQISQSTLRTGYVWCGSRMWEKCVPTARNVRLEAFVTKLMEPKYANAKRGTRSLRKAKCALKVWRGRFAKTAQIVVAQTYSAVSWCASANMASSGTCPKSLATKRPSLVKVVKPPSTAKCTTNSVCVTHKVSSALVDNSYHASMP